VGSLLVEAQSLAVMSYRATLRVLAGLDPGPESSLRKLLGAEHEQRVQELALDLLGDQGAIFDGEGRRFGYGFLVTRCLTIAGGTSEVQRNLIGERLLGLPRDPEPARPEKDRVSNGTSGNTCIGREGSESSPVGAQQRERR
ncbi:MAG: acyl-CoA dehydrogenase family protein, partial [Acidimicrobiales bacterium]